MPRNKKHPMRHYGTSDDAGAVFSFYRIWHNQKLIARLVVSLMASVLVGYVTHGVLGAIAKSPVVASDRKNKSSYYNIDAEDRPSVNICTWNLDGAGNTSDDMSIVAAVLQSCDIASVQSIGSKQYKLLSGDLGNAYGKTKLQSGMAIYFNQSLVHATGRVWSGDMRINQSFNVNPVVSEYRSGLFKFTIAQVDISKGNQNAAIRAVSALDNLVEYILKKMAPGKQLIITGDFRYMPTSVALNELKHKGFKNVISGAKSGTQNIWVNPHETKQVIFDSSVMINIPDVQIQGIKMPHHLPLMVKALVDA